MSSDPKKDALRVIFPQWQACGVGYAAEFTKDLTARSVRHGYEVGPRLLNTVFPGGEDNTVVIPVVDFDTGVEQGIESRSAVLANLALPDPECVAGFAADA
ncbi:hypothetical protein QR64_03635, partial [Rhodococcus sp. Chr-9]